MITCQDIINTAIGIIPHTIGIDRLEIRRDNTDVRSNGRIDQNIISVAYITIIQSIIIIISCPAHPDRAVAGRKKTDMNAPMRMLAPSITSVMPPVIVPIVVPSVVVPTVMPPVMIPIIPIRIG
jgi:uncharacterized membrane protein YidH (DUF202 family)